ncbi:hypothetical protein [Vibrio crassostreae]|uniref:hypothetical protein n=1 Tax=Vibrio crassostreae TaxID=246167 RepID=UPI001B310406|nr:hypothetical protein [Vibrio crassostreae]
MEQNNLPSLTSSKTIQESQRAKGGVYASLGAVIACVIGFAIADRSEVKGEGRYDDNFPVIGVDDTAFKGLCVGYRFDFIDEVVSEAGKATSVYEVTCQLPELGHTYKFSALSDRPITEANPKLRTSFSVFSDYQGEGTFVRFDPNKTDAKNFEYGVFMKLFQSDLNNIAPIFKHVYSVEDERGKTLDGWWNIRAHQH